MPQNSIAPKTEYSNSSNPVEEGPKEMTEPHNSIVLAYPIQTNEQSLPKLNLYPITLKVSYTLALVLIAAL